MQHNSLMVNCRDLSTVQIRKPIPMLRFPAVCFVAFRDFSSAHSLSELGSPNPTDGSANVADGSQMGGFNVRQSQTLILMRH
jgi:hypothetical protein